MKKYFLILLLFVSALTQAQIYSSVPGLKITNDPVQANDTTEVELLGRVITGANEGKVYSLPYSTLAIPRNTSDLVNDGEDGTSPYATQNYFNLENITSNGNTTPTRMFITDGTIDLTDLDITSTPTILSTRPNFLLANTFNTSNSVARHGFSDNNVIDKPISGWSYNTFDAFPHFIGTSSYDHYAGHQARVWYESSGTISDIRGFSSAHKISSGTVTRLHNYRVYDATGAGAITENVGLYINQLTRGTTNWAIYTLGSTQSLLEGNLNIAGKNGLPNTIQNLIRFTSGSSNLPISSIHHQFATTSEGSLHFKVRTSSTAGDAGLSEIMKLNGGTTPTVSITGKATVSSAPTASTDVVRKTELDLKSNIDSPAFSGTPTAPNPSAADYSTNIATTKFATDIASFYGTQLETESGATFTITPSRKKVVLVCTGTTITVDFPPILGNEGLEIVIINKGSGDATLASDAGGNDFWDAGSSGSGAVVPTNSTATFINDGTHYSKK